MKVDQYLSHDASSLFTFTFLATSENVRERWKIELPIGNRNLIRVHTYMNMEATGTTRWLLHDVLASIMFSGTTRTVGSPSVLTSKSSAHPQNTGLHYCLQGPFGYLAISYSYCWQLRVQLSLLACRYLVPVGAYWVRLI